MRELRDIIERWESARLSEESAVLATVVKVTGSHYRRPGAKSLICKDGSSVGSVSGGCLEADLVERARSVQVSGEPAAVMYDASVEADIIWGLGLGCGGEVHILLEPVPRAGKTNPIAVLRDCHENKRTVAIATVFAVSGDPGVITGDRLVVLDDGTEISDLGSSPLLSALVGEIRSVGSSRKPLNKSYRLPDGEVEVLIEFWRSPPMVVLFGAGNDAIPVVRLAKELGWLVTVVDHRSDYANKSRFPPADAVVVSRPENLVESLDLRQFDAAVILTHNIEQDIELLKNLLLSPIAYVGLLSSQKRTDELLSRLPNHGMTPDAKMLERLYAPIGLDLGADDSVEVALSVISEIQAVLSRHTGGFLRCKKGAIHKERAVDHN